ncbi:MAG: GxxExxY protein [Bacteroidetes bacterium]|nr:GxxExxY protein [Bacteroidota bacterium]
MGVVKVLRSDLIYPELSYQIVGCAFDVFNKLGPGHSEKVYQQAMAEAMRIKGIIFAEQAYYNVKFNEKVVGKSFFDFEVDGKIIVELKKDERFSKTHIDQVVDYLKKSELKLSIIINFTKEGVKYKRLINVSESPNHP